MSQAEKVRWSLESQVECKEAEAFWKWTDKAGFMFQICSVSRQELMSFRAGQFFMCRIIPVTAGHLPGLCLLNACSAF